MPPLAKMAHQQDGRTSSSDSEGDADETTVLVAGHLGGSQGSQPGRDDDLEDRDDSSSSASGGASLNDSAGPGATTLGGIMSPRVYQLELFQASMEQNIIVSMDTGSGKTQVAVLRIRSELERIDDNKRIWFLAPTVTLCTQQFKVLRSQLPSVGVRILTGDDNVDSWSNQSIWNAVLSGNRVVVCPYQILLDALLHSFVTLDAISLLVFDEAHNIVGKNAGRRIMMEFYHPRKAAGLAVPHILGLTASPVVRSEIASMDALEASLNAVCRGPTIHRDELLVNVNRPLMMIDTYPKSPDSLAYATANMRRLKETIDQLKIGEDPYVIYLFAQGTERSQRMLEKVLSDHKTFIRSQTKAFFGRCKTLLGEMGPWAVDSYMCQAIKRAIKARKGGPYLLGWLDAEQRYLAKILMGVKARPPYPPYPAFETSAPKLQALLRVLIDYQGDPVGIVFVQERATAAVLSSVLSEFAVINKRYKIGCMVGTSGKNRRKRDFYDLSPMVDEDGASALEQFRRGRINLLVATSVLEEGIDVPACNLVVCFDRPANLKSFIQRRGRARMRSSQLHLLLEEGERPIAREWEALESEMKRRYEDEMRELDHLKRLEEEEAEATDMDGPLAPLRARDTAAEITVNDAKQHLGHFCGVIGSRQFVDPSPEYLITEVPGGDMYATVLLPVSLPPNLRRAESSRRWKSQNNASKDAAFQAYKMLYKAGLLNENLLPIREEASAANRDVEGRPGMMMAREQYNPWADIVAAWDEEEVREVHRRRLRLSDEQGSVMCEVDALLPFRFPNLSRIELYWTQNSQLPWTVSLDTDLTMSEAGAIDDEGALAALALSHTQTLLSMSFGHRFPVYDQCQALRFIWPGVALQPSQVGSMPFFPEKHAAGGPRMVRDEKKSSVYIYEAWLPSKPSLHLVQQHQKGLEEAPQDIPYLVVRKWPRFCGLLKPATDLGGGGGHAKQEQQGAEEPKDATTKPYPRIVPAVDCIVDDDSLTMTMGKFGMLIPSIVHVMEVYMVAEELLRSTRLGMLGLRDMALVVTALSTPGSQNVTDYERIEFLGDSILKMCASITCAANNLQFPEGYLSLIKDRIVSNSRLCRAAVTFGLDRFIMTKQHTLRGWKRMLQKPAAKREISTKTLADVVEALIGAAHIEGGMDKALACISLLLPDEDWRSLALGREILYQAAPTCVTELPATMKPVERLLGYTFRNKALLVEALTHSSYNVPGTETGCLERLEFLGDSILDSVVVEKLFAIGGGDDRPPLETSDMHLLRTAMVNGDFLAFLIMDWRTPTEPQYIVKGGKVKFYRSEDGYDEYMMGEEEGEEEAPIVVESDPQPGLPLWAFMRHASGELTPVLHQTARRHAALSGEIRRA
ncbi:dicer-like protein 2, partial [Magnaporthiopsis poae ATCC 64411]